MVETGTIHLKFPPPPFLMKALIFGSGNIGKGFLGLELHKNGYDLIYTDVVAPVIAQLQQRKGYDVEIIETGERIFVPVSEAVLTSSIALSGHIQKTDLIVTAVGPDNLPSVGKALAQPLFSRAKSNSPLNIVACENTPNNSETLKGYVIDELAKTTPHAVSLVDRIIGFPNCVVDRISLPHPQMVRVEQHYEWIIDGNAWKGNVRIPGVVYTPDIKPYSSRKLYVLNGSHATIGFMSQAKKITYVHDALKNQDIYQTVTGQMKEAVLGLVHEFKLDAAEQEAYVDMVLSRFSNPQFQDETIRLTRRQASKLARNERLIGPALLCLKHGGNPVNHARAIIYLLDYQDPSSPESQQLHDYIVVNGVVNTMKEYSGLNEREPLDAKLIQLIGKEIEMGESIFRD